MAGYTFIIKEPRASTRLSSYFCPYFAAEIAKLSRLDYARLVRRWGSSIAAGIGIHKLISALDSRCVREPKLVDEELSINAAPDFVCIGDGVVTVIEFKSVLNETWLEQKIWTLKKYMALAAKKFSADAAVGALYGVLDGKRVEITLSRQQLAEEYEDLRRRVESARSPNPAKTRGPWCAHCILRERC